VPTLLLLASASACAADPRCDEPATPIFAIQGRGAEAAITGTVTTRGLVVGDYEGPAPNLRGFYLQDARGDDDPATSDGLFVFHGNADTVSLGQHVRVTGTAGEFHGQTQISARTIVQCGHAAPPPPVDVLLPLASPDALERFEGMRVRLPQTLVVTENRHVGRFGELLLSSSGRLRQPTDVVAPGAPAAARQAANAVDRILLDDASQRQNPDPIPFGREGGPHRTGDLPRAGDTVTGVVGILGHGWGGARASPNAYRIRPLGALGGVLPAFVAESPRPLAPPAVDGTVRVAAANLLNYFDSFGAGSCRGGTAGRALECRGADGAAEFERQAAKTVALLNGLEADLIGVTELENDGHGADSAISDLRARLSAASPSEPAAEPPAASGWAFVDADAGTGRIDALGRDAIKVGILYRPGAVEPVGAPAVLHTGAFGRIRTTSGATRRNRPALAQTFEEIASGERFTLVVLHLKSKASSCADNRRPFGPDPDTGDGQGHCNRTRTAALRELTAWLAGDPTGAGDPDVLIVGDLNAYSQEDPVAVLRAAGFVDLLAGLPARDAYSFVYDGQWGRLDHAFASASLAAQTTGAALWHVNADEPPVLDYNLEYKSARQRRALYTPDAFRSSDHDPLRIGLALSGSDPRPGAPRRPVPRPRHPMQQEPAPR
jgi:predicted extracellular nuclease